MKRKHTFILNILIILLLCINNTYSQDSLSKNKINKNFFGQEYKEHLKGTFYTYWGWNRGWYSNSDIRFQGDTYDFTLFNVKAFDRQSEFESNVYLNPMNMTLPQTNFRLGYYFNDKYEISFGIDHMKYIMSNYQTVNEKGYISNTSSIYNGIYNNVNVNLTPEFLTFEHTDGLNYLNIELRRRDNICYIPVNKKLGNIEFNLIEGAGGGVLFPKTNSKFLNNERNDNFYISGYGLGALLGLNITFLKYFFIQSELKAGYINMPYIHITKNNNDMANQSFLFLSNNYSLGFNIKLF